MTVTVKFLGHSGDGRDGPETSFGLGIGESRTFPDVLGSLFGLQSDYGPILVTPSVTGLVVQGQTFTPGRRRDLRAERPGRSPGRAHRRGAALDRRREAGRPLPDEPDARERGGEPDRRRRRPLRRFRRGAARDPPGPVGPLGFAQLNVANDLGVDGVAGAAFVLSTPSPGGAFAAYASVIDRATGDPRTLLPR